MEAARYNLVPEIRRLIKNGVSINSRNNDGITPLMAGVADYRTALPKLLLSLGADVNAACNRGRTALMWMLWGMPCKNEEKAIKAISVLLEAGADPFLKDADGVTAYDLAKERYSENVCRVLLEAKGKSTLVREYLNSACASSAFRV